MPDEVVETAKSAAKGGFGSEWFWRMLAAVIFVSVLWILWLLWQITPRSTVNPIVFQMQQNRRAGGLIDRTGVEGSSGGNVSQSSPAGEGAALPPALSNGAPMDNLKIETELKSPPQSAVPAAK